MYPETIIHSTSIQIQQNTETTMQNYIYKTTNNDKITKSKVQQRIKKVNKQNIILQTKRQKY